MNINRYHVIICFEWFGFGIVLSMLALMLGESVDWWWIQFPLRRAVMWINISGLVVMTTGGLLRNHARMRNKALAGTDAKRKETV